MLSRRKLFELFAAAPMVGAGVVNATAATPPGGNANPLGFAGIKKITGGHSRSTGEYWLKNRRPLIGEWEWDACLFIDGSPPVRRPDIALSDHIGRRCWIGIDLPTILHTTSIVLLFEGPAGTLHVFAKFFVTQAHQLSLGAFLAPDSADASSNITITRGTLADHEQINAELSRYCDVFDVQVVASDIYQGHNIQRMVAGCGAPLLSFTSYGRESLTGPVKDIVARVAAKTIRHDGSPLLALHVKNTYGSHHPDGSVTPCKVEPSSPREIGAFYALATANQSRLDPVKWNAP